MRRRPHQPPFPPDKNLLRFHLQKGRDGFLSQWTGRRSNPRLLRFKQVLNRLSYQSMNWVCPQKKPGIAVTPGFAVNRIRSRPGVTSAMDAKSLDWPSQSRCYDSNKIRNVVSVVLKTWFPFLSSKIIFSLCRRLFFSLRNKIDAYLPIGFNLFIEKFSTGHFGTICLGEASVEKRDFDSKICYDPRITTNSTLSPQIFRLVPVT